MTNSRVRHPFQADRALDFSVTWHAVNTDVYTHCFTGQAPLTCLICKYAGHLAATCVKRNQACDFPQNQPHQSGICVRSSQSQCSFHQCQFRQVCLSYGGDHVASRCTANSSEARWLAHLLQCTTIPPLSSHIYWCWCTPFWSLWLLGCFSVHRNNLWPSEWHSHRLHWTVWHHDDMRMPIPLQIAVPLL